MLTLIDETARLIERESGERVPRWRGDRFEIAHETFGGAYGRETTVGRRASEQFKDWSGLPLDGTYSAKACALALTVRGAPVLFWLTFDSRILGAQ